MSQIEILRILIWAFTLTVKVKTKYIEVLAKEFASNLISLANKVLGNLSKIYALTSFSGLIATILDWLDGSWDEYFTIRLNNTVRIV